MSWESCRLGDVLTLKRGHDLPEHSRQDGDVPVVSSSGITGRHKEAKAKAPGVVTGRYGTIGEVFYLEEDYWPLNTALYVIDFKGNDPQFAAYFLRNILKGYQSEKAAVPGVDRNVLHEIKVRVPDVQLQRHIAFTLSTYDDLIENNRRRMALLEESARLLYREWFVRLRFPGYEHTPNEDGVPQGWFMTNFGSVVTNFDRLRKPLSTLEREQREGEFPYHGAAGILSYIDGFVFDGRYLLIGEDGTVQTTAGNPMLQLVEGRFWVSNHAHVVQGATVSTEFLYCFLADYPIQGHVTGVAQPKITQANLNRIPVIAPSESLQNMFQEYVATIFDQRFSLQSQNQKLRAARDLLLPRLMSGEITV
jgi:type I restriction enzyme S subunit